MQSESLLDLADQLGLFAVSLAAGVAVGAAAALVFLLVVVPVNMLASYTISKLTGRRPKT